MSKAAAIITGRGRRVADAISAFEKLGIVDISTLTLEELDEIEIDGQTFCVAATKFTAEVTPFYNNKKETE